MRQETITRNIYTWDDLTDQDKDIVIGNNRDINVDHDWWESTYMDAENIGLKITGFDLGRSQECSGDFLLNAAEVARKILADHGDTCSTYQTAQDYLQSRFVELKQLCQDEADELCIAFSFGDGVLDVHDTDECELVEVLEDANTNFLKSLLEDYRHMLQKEYEYLCDDEAIIETIEANEFEFNEDLSPY